MLLTPQAKQAEQYTIFFNSDIWSLGPEYVALWSLLAINAGLDREDHWNATPIYTDTAELGRRMPGPIVDRMKILRMLRKLEGLDALSLVTSKAGLEIRLNEDMLKAGWGAPSTIQVCHQH